MTGCRVVFHTATPHPEKIKDAYKEGTSHLWDNVARVKSE
jgi:hypothetical protein